MGAAATLLAAAAAVGVAALAAATGSAAASVTLTPQQMEGPFFLDTRTLRRDVTNGRPGVPLYLDLRVEGGCGAGEGGGCKPLRDALVDLWHTDSRGVYSGFSDRGVNATGRDWMRGAQVTRPNGSARFRTIIPGWYPGRLAHLHVKVRVAPPPPDGVQPARPSGWATQLYLPDDLVRSVYAAPPYRSVGRYVSDVRQDIVLAGNVAEYAALTMGVRPATDGWLAASGFGGGGKGGEEEPWGRGYVATYTLRLGA